MQSHPAQAVVQSVATALRPQRQASRRRNPSSSVMDDLQPRAEAARRVSATLYSTSPGIAGPGLGSAWALPSPAARAIARARLITVVPRPVPTLNTPRRPGEAEASRIAPAKARAMSSTWTKSRTCIPPPDAISRRPAASRSANFATTPALAAPECAGPYALNRRSDTAAGGPAAGPPCPRLADRMRSHSSFVAPYGLAGSHAESSARGGALGRQRSRTRRRCLLGRSARRRGRPPRGSPGCRQR